MDLTLILGPMKSGKSYELISHLAPLQFTTIPYLVVHSTRNVRDATVESRIGAKLAAVKVETLAPLLEKEYQVVGIDEIHMFSVEDVAVIAELLRRGTQVVISGLDMDYRGHLFATVTKLLELGPAEIKYKRAVCEICHSIGAVYTQVYKQGQPVTDGLPPVLPEDGTYEYRPVCRACFVRT